MRTRAALGSLFGSIAVLVIGWQAGAAAAHNAGATTSTSSSSTSSGSSKTFTGTTAQTQFGPVQVKITVAGGKLTDVVAVQLTNDGGRSVQISNYAAPILRKEALAAQSASITTVGGATYTSDGYRTSLQSALDQAGLK
ncbi:MAG TPA: FMN-binding protein [Galbitalea sp.]